MGRKVLEMQLPGKSKEEEVGCGEQEVRCLTEVYGESTVGKSKEEAINQ